MSKYSSVQKYEFFDKIQHDSPLALFFNNIFNQLQTARMLSAPITFKDNKKIEEESKELRVENEYRFYQTCLFEMYAHSVIRKLECWQKVVREYLIEYNGSWEYYARSKRLRLISENGGEEHDYNEDGSIKTDVSDEVLINDSILCDLVQADWRDIVQDTLPIDLEYIYLCINVNGRFSIRDMFKAMGAGHIKTYRQENGQLVENNEDDEVLHRIKEEIKSDDISIMLYTIVSIISNIVNEISELKKDCDNKEYLAILLTRIDNIFKMDILDEIKMLRNKITDIQI